MNRHTALIFAFSFLVACGGDDDSSGGPCAAGAMQQCLCGDGMTSGAQTCDANGAFGACLPCTPGAGAGGMGGATGGIGGAAGLGGSGGVGGAGGSGGSGGAGGTAGMDEDSGVDEDGGVEEGEPDAEVDAGPDAGADAGDPPGDEGAQNGACRESGAACDDNLGCYQPDDSLPGFCTLECTDNGDCDGLSDADWTCWTMEGLCRVQCDSGNGNDDCPAGFECTNVLGGQRCIPID